MKKIKINSNPTPAFFGLGSAGFTINKVSQVITHSTLWIIPYIIVGLLLSKILAYGSLGDENWLNIIQLSTFGMVPFIIFLAQIISKRNTLESKSQIIKDKTVKHPELLSESDHYQLALAYSERQLFIETKRRRVAELRAKRLEDNLSTLQEKFDQKSQNLQNSLNLAFSELKDFSYAISHDLRAPLRIIDGFSSMIRDDYYQALDKKGVEYLETIQANVLKANGLIENIHDFSSFGFKEINRQEIDMNALFNELIHAKPINCDIVLKENLPKLYADKAMAVLAFSSLLDNAVKFSRNAEKPLIQIGYSSSSSNETVFYIRDNGIGFNMKNYEKIFKIFKKLHKPNEFEGSGMGLTLAKKVIERHNGKLWAESELGKGSSFYASIPSTRSNKNRVIR
ncbi:MAG: ATP-binding protein [Reichenbachiella sp.]|uniref:sensor histidine kinase n=1 Tax=Reichenbachiella sp. TaxID=2184521 RepID=UPI0032638E0F